MSMNTTDPKVVIANNIKKYLQKHGMSQKTLAEKIDVKPSTMSDYLNYRSKPSHGVIQKIADVFGVNKSDIDTTYKEGASPPSHSQLPNNISIPKPSSAKVPLYGSIAAGMPIEMIPVNEYVEIPERVANKYPNSFLLKITGDSMNKIVPHGAYALIDPCEDVNNGDVVAVSVNGYEATLKRFFRLHNTTVLEPDSFNVEHIAKIYGDAAECESMHVIGRLVWFMSAYDQKY